MKCVPFGSCASNFEAWILYTLIKKQLRTGAQNKLPQHRYDFTVLGIQHKTADGLRVSEINTINKHKVLFVDLKKATIDNVF